MGYEKTQSFLVKIEENGVKSRNPYHNNIHGADVLQATHCMLNQGSLGAKLHDLEKLSLLVSAACHDLNHPGLTNDFRINTEDALAITYNDRSVNENMHAAETFRLLQKCEYNFLEGLSKSQFVSLRKSVVDSILATDMKAHFTNVSAFTKAIETFGSDLDKWESRQTLSDFLMHAADISNPARDLPVSLAWTERVLAEFFLQGDREKRGGYPVSPLCDREKTSKASSQIGFVKFIVQPTFSVLSKVDSDVQEALRNLESSKTRWEAVLNSSG